VRVFVLEDLRVLRISVRSSEQAARKRYVSCVLLDVCNCGFLGGLGEEVRFLHPICSLIPP